MIMDDRMSYQNINMYDELHSYYFKLIKIFSGLSVLEGSVEKKKFVHLLNNLRDLYGNVEKVLSILHISQKFMEMK